MTNSPMGLTVSLCVYALLVAALLWPAPRPVLIEESPSGPHILTLRSLGRAGKPPDAPARRKIHHEIARPRLDPPPSVAQAVRHEPITDNEEVPDDLVEGSDDSADLEPGRESGADGEGSGTAGDGSGGGAEAAGREIDPDSSGPMAFAPESMTPPQRLSGPDPSYTPQAIEHEVQGRMQVRCIVGLDGSVRDCRIVRGLPFMDREVIETLERRRYSPARLAGRPVEVDYLFRIELRLP